MKFQDILGHSNQKDILRQCVDNDHIPHALLVGSENWHLRGLLRSIFIAQIKTMEIRVENVRHAYNISRRIIPICIMSFRSLRRPNPRRV